MVVAGIWDGRELEEVTCNDELYKIRQSLQAIQRDHGPTCMPPNGFSRPLRVRLSLRAIYSYNLNCTRESTSEKSDAGLEALAYQFIEEYSIDHGYCIILA